MKKKIIALIALLLGIAVFAYFMLSEPTPNSTDDVTFENAAKKVVLTADQEFNTTPPSESDLDLSSMDVSFEKAKDEKPKAEAPARPENAKDKE